MIVSKVFLFSLIVLFFYTLSSINSVESLSVHNPSVRSNIRSDVIVTKWPDYRNNQENTKEPGWMRKQLMKFGEVASRVGNAMGTHATKITAAIDKICEVVKTIIPFIAAVCHVGQFKFCAATIQAPEQLSEAMNPISLNLDEPDRKK